MEFKIWETEDVTDDEIKLVGLVNSVYGLADRHKVYGVRVCGYSPLYFPEGAQSYMGYPRGYYQLDYDTWLYRYSVKKNSLWHYKDPYRGFLSGALEVFENAKEVWSEDKSFIDDLFALMDKVMKNRGADELGIIDITFKHSFEYNGETISYKRQIGQIGSKELLSLKEDYEGTKAKIENCMKKTVLSKEEFGEPEYVTRLRRIYNEELTMPQVLEKLAYNNQLEDFKEYLIEWEKKVDDFWNIENVQYFPSRFWDEHIKDVERNVENMKTIKIWQAEIGYYEERQKDEKSKEIAENSKDNAYNVGMSGAAGLNIEIEQEKIKYLKGIFEQLVEINKKLGNESAKVVLPNEVNNLGAADKAGKEDKTTETAEKQENSANVLTLYRMMNGGNSM
jgi:hypothetical protein